MSRAVLFVGVLGNHWGGVACGAAPMACLVFRPDDDTGGLDG